MRSDLLRHLAEIRDRGFATQLGELRDDCACLAVPVRSAAGTLVAGLVLSGSIDHQHLLTRHLESLREHARQLAPLLT